VQEHHGGLESELECLKSCRDAALTDIQLDVSIFGDAPQVDTDATRDGDRNTSLPREEEEGKEETKQEATEEKPSMPLFSSLHDPNKCNCRVVSKATINRINNMNFQQRKQLQQAKMRHIKSSTWKIDWHCKLPKKMKAHAGKGKCFSPHKSGLTVQNEDALTIFWKFCSGTESVDVAKRDLTLLKKRNDLLGGNLKHIHVDNCCSVRPKLQNIVGADVAIGLDTFHWQERWDKILPDKSSEKTAIFRTLMQRAVFATEASECEQAKDLLLSQKKKATPRTMLKEAKATIPPPVMLEKRIVAVLHSLT